MYAGIAVAFVGLLIAMPVAAQELTAEQARRFVVGKTFSYTCFEGTTGSGRIFSDGSAIGTVQFQGTGPVRHVALPANTLRVKGDTVCAWLKGMPFEPCFNLTQTNPTSFRGAVSGLSFASCTFTRQDARQVFARTISKPRRIHPPAAPAPAAPQAQDDVVALRKTLQ